MAEHLLDGLPLPSISVVIPVYNRGALVQATVDSALEQDLPPDEVEIILVDDGSTDDTFSVLQRLYGGNTRVRLFSIPNGGVARARNFGLEKARGEFVAYLDHDDLWLPEKLRLQREAIWKNSRVGVVYCNWRHFDESGILPHEDGRVWEPRFDLEGKRILRRLLIGNFIISMSVPLIRTSSLRAVGGFDPYVSPCDDWDTWIRLAIDNDFIGIRKYLVLYHQHSNQQSSNERLMSIADRRTRWKNRRLGWRHPQALVALYHPISLRATHRTYAAVKEALFNQSWAKAWCLTFVCLRQRPLLLLTPQWIYLMKNLIQRDSRRF